ncbi:MAG: hypothetical protein ACPG8W_03645 [Candidatus Promineifilaceae bacterium]
MSKSLLLTQAAVTLFLAGLIWTIQVVHYPLFASVGLDEYVRFQAGHQWRITLIVLPTMVLELAVAGALLWFRPKSIPSWQLVLGFALVGLIWFVTVFVSSAQHGILDSGFDVTAHRTLVSTNWIRTFAWTARGSLAITWLARQIP